MGSVVESCKNHFELCRKEEQEEEKIGQSFKNGIENFFSSSKSDCSSNISRINELSFNGSDKLEITPRLKIDPYLIEYEKNPWLIYKEIEDMKSSNICKLKKVCSINDENSTLKVMKIISKILVLEEFDNGKIVSIINNIKQVKHKNILPINEFYVDKENIYVISDFCNKGSLLDIVKNFGKMNQMVVKCVMREILTGISYLHSKEMVHGNIKLENILLLSTSRNLVNKKKKLKKDSELLNYKIKLTDYGYDDLLENKQIFDRNNIGEYVYYSPDYLNNIADEKCDEWACGVVMYILLTGNSPFKGKGEEMIENVKNFNGDFSELKNITENCKNLIKKLLEPNSEKRISVNDALSHKFFDEYFDTNIYLSEYKDLNILKNLFNFNKLPSQFHYDIIYRLCQKNISDEEKKKILSVFRYIDNKNENKLSKEDLYQSRLEIKNNCTEEEFDKIFKIIDKNKSGFIELDEFTMACCDKDSLYSLANLEAIFEAITERNDQKGFITAEKIEKFFFEGQNLRKYEFKRYLREFGMSQDKQMKFEEFFDIIKNEKTLDEDKEKRIKNEKKKKGLLKKLSFGPVSVIEEDFDDIKRSYKTDN